MTRRKRLIAVVCLCLALVLGVAALVTLRTAPADTAAQTPETNAADTPEATASGAFDVRETESPAAGPTASPSAVPSAAPTTTPTAAAKATPSPVPSPAPTPTPKPETVTITIECHTALASDALGDAVRAVLPESGVILAVTEVPLETGDTDGRCYSASRASMASRSRRTGFRPTIRPMYRASGISMNSTAGRARAGSTP